MQAVCDILEQLVREGLLKRYAIASHSPSAARKTGPDGPIWWNCRFSTVSDLPIFWLATPCKNAGINGPPRWG